MNILNLFKTKKTLAMEELAKQLEENSKRFEEELATNYSLYIDKLFYYSDYNALDGHIVLYYQDRQTGRRNPVIKFIRTLFCAKTLEKQKAYFDIVRKSVSDINFEEYPYTFDYKELLRRSTGYKKRSDDYGYCASSALISLSACL